MRKTVAAFADGDIANELLRDFRIDSSVLCRSVMAAPGGSVWPGGTSVPSTWCWWVMDGSRSRGGPSGDALADRRIGRVLSRLPESPGDRWTVESLAREAAMSRSAFSERFRSLVGEAPMKYVSALRLAQAARLFRSTDSTIAQIAAQVGYGSNEALSRAFKMRYGAPPSAFRRARIFVSLPEDVPEIARISRQPA